MSARRATHCIIKYGSNEGRIRSRETIGKLLKAALIQVCQPNIEFHFISHGVLIGKFSVDDVIYVVVIQSLLI